MHIAETKICFSNLFSFSAENDQNALHFTKTLITSIDF